MIRGAGVYHHCTPAALDSLLARSEFLTAYTPYQPEVSQGTLQYIFEYQSMMCELTGLEVSNASLYDGTTATAEAMLMCVAAARRKKRVLISATVNPAVAQVCATYARWHGIALETVPEKDGVTCRESLREMLGSGDVAGVIVAQPNYYGSAYGALRRRPAWTSEYRSSIDDAPHRWSIASMSDCV